MDVPTLAQRQTTVETFGPDGSVVDGHGRYVPFWYTREGVIVKWSVFLSIFTLLTLYISIGYWHANRRIRTGLSPFAYHRWLVSSAKLAHVDSGYAYPQPAQYHTYRPEDHNMQPDMPPPPPPPPMYDPRGRPPMYEPPAGGTKAAANQAPSYRPPQVDLAYGVPSGPLPLHSAPAYTGAANPYRP